MKAIVAGAGLAGLTAAYTLQQAGWQVKVLEAGDYAGGRAATVRDGGYAIDTAATQITSGYADYLALCDALGLSGELHECSQVVGIVRDQRIHEIDSARPLSALLSPVVSGGGKLVMLKTLIDKLRLRPRLNFLALSDCHRHDSESFADYARRRLNREACDYLATPLLRGNFLRDPARASVLDWFALTDNFAGKKMLAVKGGIARLPGALASRLDVHLQAPVERVEQIGAQVAVTWKTSDAAQHELTDACIVATRLPEAVAISPAYAQLAGPLNQKLGYSRGLLVHLGFRQATRSKAIGLFLPVPEQPRIALIWMEHNKSPECAPPGHSLITCYFDAACTENGYERPDAEAVEFARHYLEQLMPELQGQCDYSRVSRWPLAIPFPEPGAYREIDRLKQRLSPQDRIQYAADYFTCVGQNSAIHYGRRAAENLIRSYPLPESAAAAARATHTVQPSLRHTQKDLA